MFRIDRLNGIWNGIHVNQLILKGWFTSTFSNDADHSEFVVFLKELDVVVYCTTAHLWIKRSGLVE